MPFFEANWPLLALGLFVLLLGAWWMFKFARRTRVTFADDGQPALRNSALIDAPPVAQRSDTVAIDSELSRLKGVGPKLIALLAELGVSDLAQVAAWDEAEISRIDAQLGRFAGRITRDDWVGQARLLQAGDQTAFEDRFGKL